MSMYDKPVPVNYFLEPGYIFLATRPAIISGVAGSCVAVCLYDKKKKFGGMNLFQLPSVKDRTKATARYGNVATIALIRMMEDNGSKVRHLEAQILGGGHDSKRCPKNIGRENVRVARSVLHRKGVKVVSEDVGGEKGRKIIFNTESNEVAVMKVDKLRGSDWFPYEDDR